VPDRRKLPRIALTSGEPAGVGPELCLAIAERNLPCELVCLADRDLLAERELLARRSPHARGALVVEHIPLASPSIPGRLDTANARYVLNLLDRAIDGTLAGEFDAIVTAPVHKGVINDAGVPFTGHTEYLADRTGTPRPVMMLATGGLRVALATTHLPLKAVSDAITVDSLCEVIEILHHDLRKWWRIEQPRIGVCGLNPHAGEGGHLGDEEIRVIAPALTRMRERGVAVSGPLPADTAFVPRILDGFDAMLAMYHDQGLPVIKHAGFDTAVNITLGLPLLRTSVDHGTALDLAGTGRADPSSLLAAISLAIELASRAA
jgi:4-hydroxythreonine-4-phosphate dehydrogenase